jgi:hypothetical protein
LEGRDEDIQAISSRYRTLSGERSGCIACINEPAIVLRLERGVAVTARGRRKYPRQTVFLDGAFSGAPFLDNKRRQYSLDHHSGCVRSFTLATCEQAAAMVFHGMPLGEGEWLLVVNGVDLDSILAAWILMNHADLARDGRKLLEAAMPFVRCEGIIDANGLEAGVLSGLAPGERAVQEARLKEIVGATRLAPGASDAEALDATIRILDRLDAILLPETYLRELSGYAELGRIPLAHGKIAVACRSSLGIYEIEASYKARYGQSLGIVLLDRGACQYTIRLASGFLDRDLEELYKALNKIDPAVSRKGDTENRWGGSSDIGGSPRLTGSELSSDRILKVIQDLYGEGGRSWTGILEPLWRALFGR